MHVSRQTLQEIESAFRVYEQEVQASNLTPKTKRTYLLYSENFVKWLKDDFVPGSRK
jgi:uncharacterized protein (UPF0333 family)